MIIGKLIKCERCKNELQFEDLLIGLNLCGELIRKCKFCGKETLIE